TDSTGRPGADGMPAAIAIHGITPNGDAAETFTLSDGAARWKSPIDAGSAPYSAAAFYVAQGGPMDLTAWFLDALLARPDKTLTLLPGGKAHAEKLADAQVGSGAAQQTVTLWGVTGIGTSPLPIWSDADNHFFALSVGI